MVDETLVYLFRLNFIECRKSSNLGKRINKKLYLFKNSIHSSQEGVFSLYKFNNIYILPSRYPTLCSHSFSFCFSCFIIISSLCVSKCHEKNIYYNLQALKEQSLKLQLYFSHLKVTDTKEMVNKELWMYALDGSFWKLYVTLFKSTNHKKFLMSPPLRGHCWFGIHSALI